MKKLIIISAIALLSFAAWQICGSNCKKANASSLSEKESVSFYAVPLVCPAAPEIGCGTKSKPVLLGLEKKNDVVSEAWLNREGTAIAVVWKENASSELRTTTADEIFKENKMDVKLIKGKGYKNMRTAFEEKKNWYRGEDVNKLSMEEEYIIVDRLFKRINSKTSLSQEKIQSLKAEFATALINRFTKNYTSEFNSNPEVVEKAIRETNNELMEIGKKYLNETEMNSLNEALALGMRPTEAEKSCSKKDCKKEEKKKSCCSKK